MKYLKMLWMKNDQLLTIANETLHTMEEKNLNEYNPIHKSKALIHTWLSWQEEPGTLWV